MGPVAVDLWARVAPDLRSIAVGSTNVSHIGYWWEYLASRSQAYWEKEGGRHIKEMPVFIPRPEAMYRILEDAHGQRLGSQIPGPMEA